MGEKGLTNRNIKQDKDVLRIVKQLQVKRMCEGRQRCKIKPTSSQFGVSTAFRCVCIRDVQNAKRLGLKTICSWLDTTFSNVYKSGKTFYKALWVCIIKSLKSLQNVPKSPHQNFPWVCIWDIFSYWASPNYFSSLSSGLKILPARKAGFGLDK